MNTKNPDRGPLLIIDGEKDHTVPWAIANAAYKKQKRNPGVTEIVKMPGRGHALTIDRGWQRSRREVARVRRGGSHDRSRIYGSRFARSNEKPIIFTRSST